MEVLPPLLGEFTLEWGVEAGRILLDAGRLPDAVVCANDEIAVGLVRSLRFGGARVPEDVAVVGFDDVAHATMCDPPLSTVRQPVEEMAAEAVRLLGQVRPATPGPRSASRSLPGSSYGRPADRWAAGVEE